MRFDNTLKYGVSFRKHIIPQNGYFLINKQLNPEHLLRGSCVVRLSSSLTVETKKKFVGYRSPINECENILCSISGFNTSMPHNFL